MSKVGRILVLLILILSLMESNKTPAQNGNDNIITIPNSFKFNDEKVKFQKIPFRFINNLIIIPLRINDSDTLHFILDTGVRSAIITEFNYIGNVTLENLKPIEIKGLGEGLELTAYRSSGNTIHLQGITGFNHNISLLTNLDFMLSQHLGIPVHGLIGYDLFRQYVIRIDYDDKFLNIYRKREFAPLKVRRRSEVLPFEMQAHKPLSKVKIKYPNADWLEVRLMVDLGASDAAWLSTESHQDITLPEKWIETYLGQGLNGDVWGKKGKIEAISIGNYVFEDPIIAYPDTEMVRPLIIGQDRHGSLGSAILQRFDVMVDYPGKRFILLPNSNFKRPFRYNKSGIEVITPFPGLPFYYVSTVTPGSAAQKAGVMKDDQIIDINGKSSHSYELEEMIDVFFDRDGRKIKMTLLRNGEKVKISFELESLF